jgi:hypothetical protein
VKVPREFIHGLQLQYDEMRGEFEGFSGTGVLVDISIKIGSCKYYNEWKFWELFPIVTDGFITT